MFHDQMMTLVETIVGPLLLLNSVGIARAAFAKVRSISRHVLTGGSSR